MSEVVVEIPFWERFFSQETPKSELDCFATIKGFFETWHLLALFEVHKTAFENSLIRLFTGNVERTDVSKTSRFLLEAV